MNRYQFEDLISEYIENELSLSKRKEFEAYLEENPEARSLVDSVRYTMDTMRSLPKVKASPKFNERLMTRIKSDIARSDTPMPSKGTFFGVYTDPCIVDDRTSDCICICKYAAVLP